MCAEVDGHFVACVVAVPDINQALRGTGGRLFPRGLVRLLMRRRHIDQARVLLLGIRADFRASGLYPLLMVELRKQAAGGPYRRAEFSWILEDNQRHQSTGRMGRRAALQDLPHLPQEPVSQQSTVDSRLLTVDC